MEVNRKEKIKIAALVKHYISQYGISENDEEAMRKQMERLLKHTPVGDESLYEIIKPDKGARVISVEEFERYCFDKWTKYLIDKTAKIKKNENYLADKERHYHEVEEPKKYHDLSVELTKDYLRSLKLFKPMRYRFAGEVDENEIFDNRTFVSPEEIDRKGHGMMIEAIYDFLFEGFNWEALSCDIQSMKIALAKNNVMSREALRAQDHLKDYNNYIGKRKRNVSTISARLKAVQKALQEIQDALKKGENDTVFRKN
ncbi:MAG: hypothetical protein J1E06_08655 [Acutalibacter sp.]|nr:hypothetical protein [Acutalibacter sp.]